MLKFMLGGVVSNDDGYLRCFRELETRDTSYREEPDAYLSFVDR